MNTETDARLTEPARILLDSIAVNIREAQESGKLVVQPTPYYQTVVTSFSLQEGRPVLNSQLVTKLKHEFALTDLMAFEQRVESEFPEFRSCLNELSGISGTPEQELQPLLSSFVRDFLSLSPEEMTTDEISKRTKILAADVRKDAMPWNVSIWLVGAWLDVPEICLDERLCIRQPKASDFEATTSLQHLLWGFPHRPFFQRPPTAILDMFLRQQRGVVVQHEVEILMSFLRLFRLGSVHYLKYEMNVESFRGEGGNIMSDSRYWVYRYCLRSTDVESLQTFYRKIKPIIPVDPSFISTNDRSNFLLIPLARYEEALLNAMPVEGRITTAITCLEALYLKDSEQDELSYRLSMRVASILGIFSLDQMTVRKDVKAAYDIRSKFVHGTFLQEKHLRDAERLCRVSVEFSRISLLVFMQLRLTTPKLKDDFLDYIDQSFLIHSQAEALRSRIQTNVVVPVESA